MVKCALVVLLPLLLWGCPDDFSAGMGRLITGLRPPTDLDGAPNGGSEVVLTWKDHATVETGYRVEMNSVPFGTPVIGGVEYLPANATTAAFAVFPNSTCYFRVFAVTDALESDPSNVIVVSTPNVPHRPDGATACTDSTTQITVKWSDVTGELAYRVEYSSSAGTWLGGPTVNANVLETKVSGLVPDTEYLFRVIAVNGQGDSTPSRPARASTMSEAMSIVEASAWSAGMFSSFLISPTGEQHLSHVGLVDTGLLYTTNLEPGVYLTAVGVDGGASRAVGGDGTSIAVDGSGKVHIASHDLTNNRIRYSTNASGSWVSSTIDSSPAGAKPRIVAHPSGSVFLYYLGFQAGIPVIKQAWKPAGQPWVLRDAVPVTVDHATTFSLTIDSQGTRHIALVTDLPELLHYGDPDFPPSTAAESLFERIPLPSATSFPDVTAIAAAGGALHVLFRDASTKSLHHSTNGSGKWITETVDQASGVEVGSFCDAAVHGPTGRLHVTYYDATNRDLRYARKDPGKAWVRKVLDVAGDVGSHASIALDPAGLVHIAYRDETNQRLRIAIGAP
jgi:hypothetical protein